MYVAAPTDGGGVREPLAAVTHQRLLIVVVVIFIFIVIVFQGEVNDDRIVWSAAPRAAGLAA